MCDNLWKKIVFEMFIGRCALCHRGADHAHHIISRSNKRFRHEILNGIALCLYCHDYVESLPEGSFEWLVSNKKRQYSYHLEAVKRMWAKRNEGHIPDKVEFYRKIHKSLTVTMGELCKMHPFQTRAS